MSMWLSKIVVVDGVEISVSAEGGSAKEALSIIDAAAEELGAAPAPAEGAGKGEGRKRRTKVEMDAARAALAPAAAPGGAALPGPAEPARVFAPPASLRPETRTEDVVWSDAPALPQEARSVGFEPPPAGAPAFEPPPPSFEAPVPSLEDNYRRLIADAVTATIALEPAWEKTVRDSLAAAVATHGGNLATMTGDNLALVHGKVTAYHKRVEDAVKNRK